MTVVAADGQYVHPVTVDEFRIATAETYRRHRRTVAGRTRSRSSRSRSIAPAIARARWRCARACGRRCPRSTRADADDGRHGTRRGGTITDEQRRWTARRMPATDPHAGGTRCRTAGSARIRTRGTTWRRWRGASQHPASEKGNPLVDMQAMTPTSRLDDPGIGLRDNGRRVLTYAICRASSTIPTAASPAARSSCI